MHASDRALLTMCMNLLCTVLQKMTYVTQLEEYEEAVMKKRLEEMTEDEVARLLDENEKQKQRQRP
jgi:cytochrome c-type biogenesis protein CcmH/NrfG